MAKIEPGPAMGAPSAAAEQEVAYWYSEDELKPFMDRAEALKRSKLPTQIFLGETLTSILKDRVICDADGKTLRTLLKNHRNQWDTSLLYSTLMFGALLPFVFGERIFTPDPDLDDGAVRALDTVMTIVSTLTATLNASSMTLSYMLSVYASILVHYDDILWFLTEQPVSLPNILTIISLNAFMHLIAVGVLYAHGLTWYSVPCAALWVVGTWGCHVVYVRMKRSTAKRWKSDAWQQRHKNVKRPDAMVG